MTVWYVITWALTEWILTEALVWACLQMADWAKTKCSEHSLSRCSGVCIAQYMPQGLYQPVHSHGGVLADTSPRACIDIVKYTILGVFYEKKTESVLENTLGKVRGTWRVKIKYITFKNWIMYCSVSVLILTHHLHLTVHCVLFCAALQNFYMGQKLL